MLPPTSHRPFCWIPFWCTRCVEVEATSRFACHFTRRRSSCSSSISSNNKKLHHTVTSKLDISNLPLFPWPHQFPCLFRAETSPVFCLLGTPFLCRRSNFRSSPLRSPLFLSASLFPGLCAHAQFPILRLRLRLLLLPSLPLGTPYPFSRTRAKALRSLASLLSSTAPQS